MVFVSVVMFMNVIMLVLMSGVVIFLVYCGWIVFIAVCHLRKVKPEDLLKLFEVVIIVLVIYIV